MQGQDRLPEAAAGPWPVLPPAGGACAHAHAVGGEVFTGQADSDERGGGDVSGPGWLAASSCCLCVGRGMWGAGVRACVLELQRQENAGEGAAFSCSENAH